MIICLTIFVTSCATAYKKNGFTGGYTDMRLANDIFSVSFHGNGYTSEDKVNAYFLRRCAEVTESNGYDYFIFLDQRTSTSSQIIQTSEGYANTTANVNGPSFNARTSYTPPSYTKINKHRREGMIRSFKEGEQPPSSLKAKIILENFEQK